MSTLSTQPSRALRLLLASLPLLAAACGVVVEGRPRAVLLITCDTLRADRLGLYGYERPTSPRLDAFAREGVVFDAAYSAAPWTRPALSSLMTGRYPEEIGAAPGNLRRMPASVETLAERIAAHGIATAAVVSNGLIVAPPPGAGDIDLPQGFAHYDDTMTGRERNRDMPERGAEETTDAALDWLRRHDQAGGGPFFLWVHYQDPHGPYTPPPPLAEAFDREPPPGEPRLPLGRSMRGEGQIPFYQILGNGTPEQRPSVYRDRYDAEIAHFDAQLGRLLEALDDEPWWDDALVIFTADHGESLGERDHWFCHGENVQHETVRVPFVVRYPQGWSGPRGRSESGLRRVEEVVTLLDVWPTVLEGLGLPSQGSRGVTLLARRLPAERVVLSNFAAARPERRQWSASDGRWRLVWGADGVRRLYDVRADPTEAHDLAAEQPGIVRRLDLSWEALRRAMASGQVEGSEVELDARTREAMRALGYLELEDDGGEE